MRSWTSRRFGLALGCLALVTAACVPQPPAPPQYLLEPLLCQDVAGKNPNYAPMVNPAGAGAIRPLQLRTLDHPDANANDGSPAVMYIRPAVPGSGNEDKWVIVLDGGGTCTDADHCLERFCSLGANPAIFERAGKMSSLGMPAAIEIGQGIQGANPANAFGDWNHVFVPYQSSDNWTGSAGPKTVATATGLTYQIEFRGEAIVRDVFAVLRRSGGVVLPDSGDERYAMPNLEAAERVLVAGGSAGSNGVRHHLDRIATELGALGIEVRGVLDAALSQPYYDPALSWAGAPWPSYDDMGAGYLQVNYRTWWETDDSALDTSCLAALPGLGLGEWYCMDTIYLLLEHLTTPVFVRADLTDPVGLDSLLGFGFFANEYDVAVATAALFPLLPPGSGWFGDRCRNHVMMEGRPFTRTTMQNGSGLTFHDQLVNWVFATGGLTTEVQGDSLLGPPYDDSLLCN